MRGWLRLLLLLPALCCCQGALAREPQPVTAGAHAFDALFAGLANAPAAPADAPLPEVRGQLVVIGFTAPWCRRCGRLQQALAAVPEHELLHVRVAEAGAPEGDALHATFDIRRVPALVLLDPAGRELLRRDGRDALELTLIDAHLQQVLQAVEEVDL